MLYKTEPCLMLYSSGHTFAASDIILTGNYIVSWFKTSTAVVTQNIGLAHDIL